MRRVHRLPLDPKPASKLQEFERDVIVQRGIQGFDPTSYWSARRRSCALNHVAKVLGRMAGEHQRCMYCVDSHGTDIEHFWPKSRYPDRMFRWSNLLLCCTECGRFKGKCFPLDEQGNPLLIDPSADDPWEHLDFEPRTGNLTARFVAAANSPSRRGLETVRVLQLDQREALSEGLKKTYRRLADRASESIAAGRPGARELIDQLRALDDHGLLAWCFSTRGAKERPFAHLRQDQQYWDACVALLRQ